MIVITCPGQGSQTPGFLNPWIEDEANKTLLGELGEAAGVDLVLHGTVSDADTIRDTAVAQPLIVAAGILAWNSLVDSDEQAARVGGVAGHSVGEITAAYAAGIFDASTAGSFVGLRSRLMAQDAAKETTSMSAVVGGVEADVLAALESLDLSPANFNGGGQIVAAGAPDALARLQADAPRGTRVVPLQVAGAFHTRYMSAARDALAAKRAEFTANDPARTIWSNHAGEPVADGGAFVDLMVQQVARPVRWDACMTSFADAGITGMIELTPGGTLTGLAKRGLKGTPAVAIKTPDDLDTARRLLAEQ